MMLHIFRSKPDEQVRELIRAVSSGETREIALYEELVDYDQLLDDIFSHDQVICWW
jgi:hypothetical protein